MTLGLLQTDLFKRLFDPAYILFTDTLVAWRVRIERDIDTISSLNDLLFHKNGKQKSFGPRLRRKVRDFLTKEVGTAKTADWGEDRPFPPSKKLDWDASSNLGLGDKCPCHREDGWCLERVQRALARELLGTEPKTLYEIAENVELTSLDLARLCGTTAISVPDSVSVEDAHEHLCQFVQAAQQELAEALKHIASLQNEYLGVRT
jgi:hypothetical protein